MQGAHSDSTHGSMSDSEASPSHELALQKLLPLLSRHLKAGVVSRGVRCQGGALRCELCSAHCIHCTLHNTHFVP